MSMSLSRLLRLAAWVLLMVIGFFTLSPIELRPVTPALPDVERIAAFVLLGAVFCLAYSGMPVRALLGVVAAVVVLEVLQNVVPGRHGLPQDAVMKASGAVVGAALAMLFDRRYRSR